MQQFDHKNITNTLQLLGSHLGFEAVIEKRIAAGARADVMWIEILNKKRRVKHVFEVQVGGNTDSLLLNLIKAAEDPTVDKVVAVSDLAQLEKIKSEASCISILKGKLEYWDYQQMYEVFEKQEFVYNALAQLGLA